MLYLQISFHAQMQIDDPDGKKKEISPSSKQTQFNQCLDYELQLNSNIDISDAELVIYNT